MPITGVRALEGRALRRRAGRLALYLVGMSLAAACGGPTEPEFVDVMDLGVPEVAVINGLELRAELEVALPYPSTHVRVSVSATNRTDQLIEFVAPDSCIAMPLVYARRADEWIQYRYPDDPNFGRTCLLIVVSIWVNPGETTTLDVTELSVADWVGAEFRPGTHVVTAFLRGAWGGERREVELLAGQVDAK